MNKEASEISDALRHCWKQLGIPEKLIVDRGLPVFSEPTELRIVATESDGREHRLVPAAATAWSAMQIAAEADAVNIHIVSAYRSIARQIEIVAHKLRAGQTPKQIFSVSAPPGCSEHHTGAAVDIGTPDSPPLEIKFEVTPAYRWLDTRAGDFGFSLTYPRGNRWGYTYEPWHWCHQAGTTGR